MAPAMLDSTVGLQIHDSLVLRLNGVAADPSVGFGVVHAIFRTVVLVENQLVSKKCSSFCLKLNLYKLWDKYIMTWLHFISLMFAYNFKDLWWVVFPSTG